MKQTITKEQWDELSVLQQAEVLHIFNKAYVLTEGFLPNIGQMIEFLINEVNEVGVYYCDTSCMWTVDFGAGIYEDEDHESKQAIELCDALWEEVKYKLNN